MTRHLLLSDLHGNLEALEACLERAREAGYDRVLLLGDLVGYGADPGGVLDLVRGLGAPLIVRGNHDKVAAGLEEGIDFSEPARAAIRWTRGALRPDHLQYLAALPRGPLEFAPGSFLAHASPLDEDAYVLGEKDAGDCFEALPFRLCFFGHTHWPCAWILEEGRIRFEALSEDGSLLHLQPDARHLINPGSIGQPRDRDPRASFGIYDDAAATVAIHRVAYPLEIARRKILAADLPAILGNRLRRGA